jgi:hypothetical protein
MAFKMNGAPFQKHKPGHKKSKTGHIPPYEKGDDLRERFLAKRAAKTEKKFDDYLDKSGSVESPKGDRLAIRANKAADAHQEYTDKRAKKAVAKRTRKEGREHNKAARKTEGSRLRQAVRGVINKRKNKEVGHAATREDRRKENKQERKQNRADRKANRKNK